MGKQLVQAVKGTRDFYPEDMAFRRWLYGKIKEVSESFGYQEFEGPELEYIDLYVDKTSEEIIKEQAFSLKDRDNRTLILRPEITPTFARMVAQRSQQLPKPIRWFSFGRAWRYEQPQKGRGREFFQWEINILGPETPEADAEILALAARFFQELDLTPEEVTIRVSDRSMFESFCNQNNIPQDRKPALLRFMDRIEKIDPKEILSEWSKQVGLPEKVLELIRGYLNNQELSPWLAQVWKALENYPKAKDYIKFDPQIFRGFDYYTRTVFEAWAKQGGLKRALFGGGRFDDLTATIGGDRVPGVGMAPGDMPIEELLKDLNKKPGLKPETAKVLVTVFSADMEDKSAKTASQLRSEYVSTELWVEPDAKLDKQLKYADQKGIPFAVIIGPDEEQKGVVTLKDLANKTQEQLPLDKVLQKIKNGSR